MKYVLTAQNKEGETYEETVEAADRFAVYRDVRARGDTLVSLTDNSRAPVFSLASLADFLNSISLDEKVLLARNVSAMIQAGLTVSRALGVMERQSKNTRLKSVLGDVAAEIKRGDSLAVALAKFPNVFPSIMVSMVRAGEESGKLAESLTVVATQLERSSNLKKKIKGALVYPAIVIIAMAVIGVLMLAYVVPTLSATFQSLHADLPLSTRIIISLSDFLLNDWLLAAGAFAVVAFGLTAGMRTPRGGRALDWLLLRTPLIKNLIMETNAARTTRTLASLLSAGVDVVLSLAITRDVLENSYYKGVLSEAGANVTKGGPIADAFAKHPELYPPMVSEMIAVGEETGRVSNLLLETAEFYEASVERQTKDLSTVIEPFLMLLIGAAVGFFAISMISPIYSLSNSIG